MRTKNDFVRCGLFFSYGVLATFGGIVGGARADETVPPAAPTDAPAEAPPIPAGNEQNGVQAAETPVVEAPPPSTEVTVRGKGSEAKRRRESAETVKVVDTIYAKQQSRDLGDVLSSVEGVAVRRTGGLGSATSFSLNGLYDKQIRIFFDGIPADVANSPFGVSAIPVSLISGIEIYRGVVPIRFGADALGGAVNLVPIKLEDSNVYVSYQRGSFGTHRAAIVGKYQHQPSGFFATANGVFDRSRNDYLIDVEVADKSGRKSPRTVRRFHDVYQSYGGALTVGFLDKRWAKRLSLQIFGYDFEKEIQHDVLMARPIGEATYSASSAGGTLRWDHDFNKRISTQFVGNYAHQNIRFLDTSKWIYNWLGERVAKRAVPGELDGPHDATIWQNSFLGRGIVEWRMRPEHLLRVATTGRLIARTGTEKAIKGSDGIDLLAGARDLGTLISGVEYELNALDMRPAETRADRPVRPDEDDRLQNIFALKHYYYKVDADNVKSGFSLDSFHTSGQRFGIGDSLRFRVHKKVSLKASYELATRVPDVEEFFGDSLYIQPNIRLKPELSHNANVGVFVETRKTPAGNFTLEADGFLREVQDQIVALADAKGIQYDNIGGTSVKGFEGSLQWISPGNWLILNGNLTWQDLRNVSTSGKFEEFNGERIPNKPWIFANWGGRFQWKKLLTSDDMLAPYYSGRFVHWFYRTWESIGDPNFKAVVPTQIAHTLGLTYSNSAPSRTSVTFEVDNLTDTKLFDYFGVQKPGRSVSVKVTGEL